MLQRKLNYLLYNISLLQMSCKSKHTFCVCVWAMCGLYSSNSGFIKKYILFEFEYVVFYVWNINCWNRFSICLKYWVINLEHESVSCSVMSDSLRPPLTVARQTALSMEFFRQEYWSELPCPSPGVLPDPGIKSWVSCIANSLPPESPGEPQEYESELPFPCPGDLPNPGIEPVSPAL